MHVIATAGHVDHGKSSLVKSLTGTDPDRWAEERRRGMTLDLGFAWAEIGGHTLAFVDVPGHERFVSTMLAGAGPVPAVLLVVAADEGWKPQTAEHVAALDALGVTRAVVAVSRCDLADPGRVTEEVTKQLGRTGLAPIATVAVSAVTGEGLDDLAGALTRLADSLPTPDASPPARLWVDRAFTIRGAGTVLTGTLPVGTLHVGDQLALGDRLVRVRALQCLGRSVTTAEAVSRVAVNVRGVEPSEVRRGDALLTPGSWRPTATVDARLTAPADVAARLTLHTGSAAVPVHVRPLGPDTVRLRLDRPLPLGAGDAGLLRDPGLHQVVAGVRVLDPEPPTFARRGAAALRGRELADPDGAEKRRRRRRLELREGLLAHCAAHARARPLEPGPTVGAVCRALGLADEAELVALLQPPLVVQAGRVVDISRPVLPPAVSDAVIAVQADLADQPFSAPDATRLAGLGLGPRELAAAARVGALLQVAEGVVLSPGADVEAARRLAQLDAPFTVSEARAALGTTRRVAVPLLELLDRRGLTQRRLDDRRTVTDSGD